MKEEEVVPESVSEESGSKNLESQSTQQPKSSKKRVFAVIAVTVTFVVLVSAGFWWYFGFSKQRQGSWEAPEFPPTGTQISSPSARPQETMKQTPTEQTPTEQTPTVPVVASEPNVTLETGFSFYLPAEWSAKISDQSKQYFFGRFFVPGANDEKTYVEIESTGTSQLTSNPLITITTTERKRSSHGIVAVIAEGKENFRTSDRQVKRATFENGENTLILTLYQSPADRIINEFDGLVSSVAISTRVVGSGFRAAAVVHAAENIDGINKEDYKKIEVMGDPLPGRITENDRVYGGTYADFYKFRSFKGQRLTIVAKEDQTTNPKSFIKSRLLSRQGREIASGDTRIEFTAPYTGVYYYIVYSFKNEEGGYLLKVFDRDQTENLLYVKYADGSERLLDSAISPPQYGEKEVAILFQFISPIEVIDDNTVRYFSKPEEFEPGLGLITTPVQVYLKKESYLDFSQQGSKLPEENPENLVGKKITKLSQSKILIEPEAGGLFPKNSHIVVVERAIGRYRFFTEEKLTP